VNIYVIQTTNNEIFIWLRIISKYFSGSFHFAPPLEIGGKISSKKKPASLQDSLVALHLRIGEYLELGEGKFCVDIGCGIGNVMEHLANTGAVLTGKLPYILNLY
jgi:2-polyprenyl-3-methyl-5-hydroxy-6-metoxy-1,4-benzoquinol methylase